MIIVSQNRTVIVNFNNISVIAINNLETNKDINCLDNMSNVITLGKYNTEERTKEVFKELMEATTSLFESYYMPEN